LDTFGIPRGVLSLLKPNPNEVDSTEAGSEFSPIETAYLRQLKATHRARARAAMRWRPRLLKALAMSCRLTLALQAARVCYNTVRAHERNDPEFAAQLKEAEEEGAQLLHDVCFNAALEGELEPVYFKGQVVGHIRKIDNRLRIEMLRAHMSDKFKTPGTKIAVNAGSQQNFFVCGPEQTAQLVALRQEALARMNPNRPPIPQITEIAAP
jgi:hypothetical protein